MNQYDKIDHIIIDGINIIELEVAKLKAKSLTNMMQKIDIEQVIEYLKALVIVRKDWRQGEKEEVLDTKKLSDDELEAAILKEAEKILDK